MPLGEGPILILEQVGRQHSGTYQCKAENGVREAAYADVNLKVLCKFSFRIHYVNLDHMTKILKTSGHNTEKNLKLSVNFLEGTTTNYI